MLWRTSFSSGSSALKTLTLPVFSSVEPPPELPPPPFSSPLSALHAAATRTSTAVNATSDHRRIAPPLVPSAIPSLSLLYGQTRLPGLTRPRRRSLPHRDVLAVAADDVREPAGARLRGAPLGRIVDVDEPEPLRIALRPLEVVEERPDEVPLDRRSRVDRETDLPEMPVEVRDAVEVLHDPP